MIVLSSPNEIRRYRRIKLAVAIPLLVSALAVSISAATAPKPKGDLLSRQAAFATETDFREDWPIEIALDRPGGTTLPTGVYFLEGRGPENSVATVYEGEHPIMDAKVDATGRWRAAIKVNEAGLMSFHAEMARGKVRVGRTKSLPLTFTDGVVKNSTDLGLANYLPGDKVPSGPISIEGFAPPGDFIRLYADKVELGRAEVDLDGKWTLDVEINTPGKRSLSVYDEITQHTSAPIPIQIVGP